MDEPKYILVFNVGWSHEPASRRNDIVILDSEQEAMDTVKDIKQTRPDEPMDWVIIKGSIIQEGDNT